MSERDAADVTVIDNTDRRRFEAIVDGEVAGFASYRHKDDTTIEMHHTEVDDAYEGRGVGGQLARGALDAVRASGRKVLPTCPFIKRYIGEHDEYRDLMA
jgi:uncharacterized protein